MLRSRQLPTILLIAALSGLHASVTVAQTKAPGQKQDFPVDVWTPSPFHAIRWPSTTPEIYVEGTWYQLSSVNGVAVDRIISFIIRQHRDPISCYQMRFEADLLNYVDKIRGVSTGFDSATLEVKDLSSGQTRKLMDVPATVDNYHAIQSARRSASLAAGSPKMMLRQAIDALDRGGPENIVDYFSPLDPAQHDELMSAARFPEELVQICDEMSKQFKHADIGPADHFFKPFWWLEELNEIDHADTATVDLRSLGIGLLPLHKTATSWKIDATWLSDNTEGLQRLIDFQPKVDQFKSQFEDHKYQTPDEILVDINSLSRQFDAAIPTTKPVP